MQVYTRCRSTNRPKVAAQILVSAVSILFAIFLITAFLPIVEGGIEIKEDSSDITWEVSGLNLITEGGFEISSKMPYDLNDVGIEISLDADDVKTIIVQNENNTITSNSTKYISMSGETSLIDAILMVAYYNNGSDTNGIMMPLSLDVQGYYLYSMVGVQVDLDMDMTLSSAGTLVYDDTNPNILVIQTYGVESGSLLADIGAFDATVNDTAIEMSLTKNGNNMTFTMETSDPAGIISELKECAEENEGTITITSSGIGYVLDPEQTSNMIQLLESMYGGA
jgi:hypothetical protein